MPQGHKTTNEKMEKRNKVTIFLFTTREPFDHNFHLNLIAVFKVFLITQGSIYFINYQFVMGRLNFLSL
jgi:hypothetical protein